MKRIAVVGCGAMGSIYAALFSSAGHEVIAVDANTAHVDAINQHGLHVWGASGDRVVRIPAYLQPPNEQVDLIIIAVKARHVSNAARSVTELMGPHTTVLTIQNGLGSADVVAEEIGAERLMVGVAQGFGASRPQAGHVHHNDMKAIRIGSYSSPDGALGAKRVESIAELWRAAGFDASSVNDIAAVQWDKLICNVAYSAPCAVTGLTVGQVLESPSVGPISLAAAREACLVAKALRIPLSFDDVDAYVQAFAARMPDAKPSVLLDVQAGQVSEVGVINGAIPREAEKVGLTAPVNATLTGLVQALEHAGAQKDVK